MNTCSVSGQSCVFEWGSRLLFYYQMPIPHRHHAPDGLEGLIATLGRERRQSYSEADFCCFLASRCRRRDGYWPRQDEKLREGEMVALVVDRSWPMTGDAYFEETNAPGRRRRICRIQEWQGWQMGIMVLEFAVLAVY